MAASFSLEDSQKRYERRFERPEYVDGEPLCLYLPLSVRDPDDLLTSQNIIWRATTVEDDDSRKRKRIKLEESTTEPTPDQTDSSDEEEVKVVFKIKRKMMKQIAEFRGSSLSTQIVADYPDPQIYRERVETETKMALQRLREQYAQEWKWDRTKNHVLCAIRVCTERLSDVGKLIELGKIENRRWQRTKTVAHSDKSKSTMDAAVQLLSTLICFVGEEVIRRYWIEAGFSNRKPPALKGFQEECGKEVSKLDAAMDRIASTGSKCVKQSIRQAIPSLQRLKDCDVILEERLGAQYLAHAASYWN